MIGHWASCQSGGWDFLTHKQGLDARMETLVANLALMGAPIELLEKVDKC